MKTSLRTLLLIWAGWFLVLYAFQAIVTMRLDVVRPDSAVEWSAHETTATSNQGKIYLNEPFLNNQVAWDSEYYLGIATGGYKDLHVWTLTTSGETIPANDPTRNLQGSYSLSYAFFPLYPWTIWFVHWPLKIFGLDPIATSTLGGCLLYTSPSPRD